MNEQVAHQETVKASYAKTNLDDAIDQLAGTRKGVVITDDGVSTTRIRESRYVELRAGIEGQQGTENRNVARSMPPLWVDSCDWLVKVDRTVREWVQDGRSKTTTPDRLYSLTELTWRPQDVPLITHYTETLLRWVAQADQLLEPEQHRTWELAAPCPACATKTVHRKDSGGDWVRQAALTVNRHGCVCQACKASWNPMQYEFLAKVIGCPAIDGISTGTAGELR